MTALTPAKVYRLLLNAGFRPAAAATMTAIAGAESGWNPNAVGDVALETAQWGPSVGLFQIRTLKAQTGTGGPRDIRRLRGNPQAQAAAAHDIWSGAGFGAWTTYSNGSYRRYLGTAGKPARGSAGSSGGVVDASTQQALSWSDLDPLNWPGAIGGGILKGFGALGGAAGKGAGNAAGVVAGALWSEIQPFVLTMTFATAGLALVVIGVTVTARPTIDRVSDKVDEVKGQAAQAAQAAAMAGAVA